MISLWLLWYLSMTAIPEVTMPPDPTEIIEAQEAAMRAYLARHEQKALAFAQIELDKLPWEPCEEDGGTGTWLVEDDDGSLWAVEYRGCERREIEVPVLGWGSDVHRHRRIVQAIEEALR